MYVNEKNKYYIKLKLQQKKMVAYIVTKIKTNE